MNALLGLWADSGISQLQAGQAFMLAIGLLLLYLAIKRRFEPLLLLPIGFGTILVNIPGADFNTAPIYDALGHRSPGVTRRHFVLRLQRRH